MRRWIEDLPGGGMTTRAFSQKPGSRGKTGASARVSVSPRSRCSLSSSREYFLVSLPAIFIHLPGADDSARQAPPGKSNKVIVTIALSQGSKSLFAVVFASVLFYYNWTLENQSSISEIDASFFDVA